MKNRPIFENTEQVARARADLLQAYEDWTRQAAALGFVASRVSFVKAFNAGKVKVGADVRHHIGTIDYSTFVRWQKLAKQGELRPKWRGRGSMLDTRPAVRNAFEKIIAARPGIAAQEILVALAQALPNHDTPSLRTIQRYLEKRSNGS